MSNGITQCYLLPDRGGRPAIEIIALNCLVFEKIAFVQFGDRQTDKQTNRWTRQLYEADLAVASGGLINKSISLNDGKDYVSTLVQLNTVWWPLANTLEN